jgi:hypothetical protein
VSSGASEPDLANYPNDLERKLESLQPYWGWWLATYAFLLLIQISSWWYPTPDSVSYLSIARSLANGRGLTNLGYRHIAYPPGYPLLMSLAFIQKSPPFLTISIMNWIMAVLFMFGLYRWTCRLASEAAPLLTGLTMVNVTFWIYYRRTLTELAFMTVMIWTVDALDRALEEHSASRRALFTSIGCLLAIYLSMIREVGVLVVAAFAAALCMCVYQRRLKPREAFAMIVGVTAPAAAAVIAFIIYDLSTYQGPSSFVATHLSGFLNPRMPLKELVPEGVRLQISAIGRILIPGMFKAYAHSWLSVDTAIYLSATVVIAIGWVRLLRKHIEVLAYTLPLYLGLYSVWGFDADTRYVLPMLPILVVALWYWLEPFRGVRLTILTVLLVANLGVAIGFWRAIEEPRSRECNEQWPEVTKMARAIESDPGPVAAANKVPECVRLMLSFTLDRPVADLSIDGSAVETSKWLLANGGDRDPTGYREDSQVAAYKLLRNTQSLPTTAR